MTRVISSRFRRSLQGSPSTGSRTFGPWIRARVIVVLGALLMLVGSGCQSVPIGDQGNLSKPNMIFADTAVFGYDSGLVAQIEPGAATSGGAQAAGCTSCK